MVIANYATFPHYTEKENPTLLEDKFLYTVISLIEAAACIRNNFLDFWCAAFIWERLQLKFWFASKTSLKGAVST